MDITKRDSKMLKGVAILSMLMLHLFCRRENLPYTPLLWIGGTPLIYYFALFGDICVAVYCFVSGYAHYMQSSEAEIKKRWKHLLHFFIPFWVIATVFSLIGLLVGNAEIPGSLTKFALNCLTIQNSYNGAWWYANTYILLVAYTSILNSIRIVFPQKDIVTQFCKMADGLIEIIATNLEEIRKLNDAREYIQLSLSR